LLRIDDGFAIRPVADPACESGSGSRVLMTKNVRKIMQLKNKIAKKKLFFLF